MSGYKLSLIGISLILWVSWSLLFTGADSQVTHPDEVKALRAIKKSLVDPNGNLSNWRRGDPCRSNWTGILCYNETKNDGYFHVRELQLLDMNLSGKLSSELGRLSYMKILDVMWNAITGTIPKEIGNIKTLELLLLNGNQLSGSLPEELGYLPNLNRIQIDQNHISGPLPVSFANLKKTEHFHMNNNSISGQIPPELSKLPKLLHLLLDNNNLSGYLPPELAQIPNLHILQLDNNNFDGSQIPDSYGNMSRLLKLSLRNCSLQGPLPNLGNIPNLTYIDLSFNQLSGPIPSEKLSDNITTIDLSYNNLNGTIPSNFSGLPHLQKLSLANNSLSGSVPSIIWQNRTLNATETLILDLRSNKLLNISGTLVVPQNVTISLQGNPLCSNSALSDFCGPYNGDVDGTLQLANKTDCPPLACPPPYEYALPFPTCFCALPLLVGYRLKSPGFHDFRSYVHRFEWYITSGLKLNQSQLRLNTFALEAGPRVRMYLRIFPIFVDNSSSRLFNKSEVLRLRSMFTGWLIPDNDFFGPYELLNFTLLADYREFIPPPSSSSISKGALAGIILGVIAGAVTISAFVSLVILRLHMKKHHCAGSKRNLLSKISVKIDGVKEFNFEELTLATKNFNNSSLVGQGGYGKVYKGTLTDGTVVAIKRALEGSLQGQKEFLTEIELLSRLHHRNLVSLLGYCGEEGEQMLVYEFMPNGTLRDHISGKCKEPLSFAMRLRVALGSAKGILYLHTEADPPIFHRDIKASNILLDAKFIAKVADFGLSRLAPVPNLEGTLPAHVSTVVKGTPGYLDPEYFLTHKLTDKSDVYSLGVVFLELLTGMQPISHGKNIVREVNLAYRSGMIFNVIDDRMGSYPSECVEKFINLALKCCQEETEARPSMAEVVRELENIRLMMPESDSIIRDSLVTDSEKDSSTPSSTSAMKYPYVSADVSGSDLVSGVVPSIHPR
ncbi:putative LRR receptor-like serine/threonine-protein kinase At1g06840 isoform X1 [Nicotiana tabacum]|uniref:non-specific serine/threonine protein kinase n=3 Tax=Nicotiana TaxID=4085 RepID=A0A1S4B394_TOBAC|nr:PREDICTED: probable LRR receptor-like serine/threonine-protein kinase At1g06840 [Nicotiana sylvestris]XP_016483263.1 PREDICTED: probable LRR receptor-like serine/threonine-protein kinase At1g06840 isoform X1 [Nicotiana tabacum]